MPRRTAGGKNPLSRKEQNRINQRAFRERKRQEFEDMRKALACMEAGSASTQQGNTSLKPGVDHVNVDPEPCHEQSNNQSNDTVCPADLNKSVLASQEGPTHGDEVNVAGLPVFEVGPSSSTANHLHNGAEGEYQSSSNNNMPALLADTTNLPPVVASCYPDDTWLGTKSYELEQRNANLLANSSADPGLSSDIPRHTNLVADYANAQHLASKSAEWYAKAAEVGLLKIATMHRLTYAEMPTWQLCPPTYTPPAIHLRGLPEPCTALPSETTLCSQATDPWDATSYESWYPDPTQAWQWDSFGQPIPL
jgi:hypothetical protein